MMQMPSLYRYGIIWYSNYISLILLQIHCIILTSYHIVSGIMSSWYLIIPIWYHIISEAIGTFLTTWHDLANDHEAAHLQAKMVPINLIWRNSTQWLLSSSICKVPRVLIMPMGMPMMLHIYRSRQFQRTLFGVNRPSGCGVTVSARSGWMDGQKETILLLSFGKTVDKKQLD